MEIIFKDIDDIIYPTDVERYAESFKRAMAIFENLESIESYQGKVGMFNKHNMKSITIYGSDYADEYYVEPICAGNGFMLMHLEVLTDEEAESNEREYMRGNDNFTKEERENYKLGETVQWYKPLGNSGYWYTLK